jgi:hypothetical protein
MFIVCLLCIGWNLVSLCFCPNSNVHIEELLVIFKTVVLFEHLNIDTVVTVCVYLYIPRTFYSTHYKNTQKKELENEFFMSEHNFSFENGSSAVGWTIKSGCRGSESGFSLYPTLDIVTYDKIECNRVCVCWYRCTKPHRHLTRLSCELGVLHKI